MHHPFLRIILILVLAAVVIYLGLIGMVCWKETHVEAPQDNYDAIIVLGLCNAVIQPGENAQNLFMLLLHTLSRLTFTDQEWRPLLCGFLIHFAQDQGVRPRLRHCIRCSRSIPQEENCFFDLREGGVVCRSCHMKEDVPVSAAQRLFLEEALQEGSASWVNTPERHAPFGMMRKYVETQLGSRLKSGLMLPDE